jgi:hypothetical protein
VLVLYKADIIFILAITLLLTITTYSQAQNKCDTTICDKVCQLLAVGQWFSSGTLVSATNKNDCQDTTEILLKTIAGTF